MAHFPHIAVVILNWNGRRYLEQFLPSVMATRYANWELVVADNGSTDDSLDFLSRHYPSVRQIRLTQNHGFAGGYNRALREVDADYYVLLNSDVETEPGWLQPMADLLESHPGIAACQPKILSYHHRDLFEYAGAAGGWLDQYGYPFARGRVFDICEKDSGQYDSTEPVFWASGAALFIRARVFHEMKGFDEFFFAHQEEIDLCWRIQLAGHQVWACPQAVVYHVGGGTLPRGNSLKTFLNFRNNRIMLSKNLPWQRKIWTIPLRFGLDAVSALKGLFSGDPGYFLAVMRAQFAFLKWKFFQQKQSVFPANRHMRLRGMLRKNMAWQHFVRGRKAFSKIVSN